jgi:integrase
MGSRNRLTDLKVRNFRPDRTKRLEIPDGKQGGLYLIIQPSGRKRFCVRYRVNGRPAKLTLKPGLSLADARKAAGDAMYALEKGTDPREARKTEKQKAAAAAVNTLAYVCERYLKREGGKLRTIKDRESALRRLVYPTLGDRQVDTIRRTEISALLDKIEDNNGKRAADLVLSYLRKIFNWHAIQSDTFSSPIVPGMGRYDIAANRRKRFLNDDEIRKFWKATEIDRPGAACLRFLLLTGCRKKEAAGLRWDEINGHEWLLPASRHKNKRVDLLRPLSDRALAIVHAQPRIDDSPCVFTTNGKQPIDLDGASARRFRKSFGISNWRIHDLRRTSRTLLARAKVDSDIAEKALGHLPSGLRDTYDQHKYQPELAHAFAELAALIERIVNPPSDIVTPMRRKRLRADAS